MSPLSPATVAAVIEAVDVERLLATAVALVGVPSPTLSAGAVADRLAQILTADGFAVERPVADWPDAPAVVVRYASGRPGRVLQFDGHLDTVHLPFVPPRVAEGVLYGSGAADMKGGIAAAVEALRVLRDLDALPGGGILLTAHDHHEGPWGDRRQVQALIRVGIVGDAVMLPEYLGDFVPLAGRGMAIFEARLRREGTPVHEVFRPAGLPDVIATGAELVRRLNRLDAEVAATSDPYAGRDSVFVGRIESGEIYNQAPVECRVWGTRRWVTPGAGDEVRARFDALLAEVAATTGTAVEVAWEQQGEAFRLAPDDAIVAAFQAAHVAVTGEPLPYGGKPFVDDGNTYDGVGGIPALTHGPRATGAHTTDEAAPVAELLRVARVYALTAVAFCG